MNVWKDFDSKRISPFEFICYIEISKGSKNKYELDKETGMLYLDRILYTSTHYPANYGFIPRTYCDDHDPLDVLVLCDEAILPQALVKCKPIGVMEMYDQNETDEKIIAVPVNDPDKNCYNDISELPNHVLNEIMHFFSVYKTLEHKEVMVKGIYGKDEAIKVIKESMDLFKEKFC